MTMNVRRPTRKFTRLTKRVCFRCKHSNFRLRRFSSLSRPGAEEKFKRRLKNERGSFRHKQKDPAKQQRTQSPLLETYLAELWVASSDQVFALLERSLEADIEHEVFFQKAMLKFTDVGELYKAERVFELMRKHEFRHSFAAWNAYFRLCARLEKFESAISAHHELKKTKIQLNQRCYNSLIESYGAMKRLPELLQEFDDLDLERDLVFYTMCIKECARTGNVDAAEKIYAEIKRKRIEIDCMFCNEFLSVLKADGDINLARQYFHHFDERLNGGLNKEVFNRYLSIIQYNGVEEVETVLEEMKLRAIPMDDFTILHLAQALAYAKDVDRVISLIEDGADVFRSLVVALHQSNRLSELPEYVNRYMALATNSENYSAIFSVLYRAGEIKMLDELYERLLPAGPAEAPTMDFHRYTVGVVVACLRYRIRQLNSGDSKTIIVGRGAHQRRKHNADLKASILRSSALSDMAIIREAQNPGMLIITKR